MNNNIIPSTVSHKTSIQANTSSHPMAVDNTVNRNPATLVGQIHIVKNVPHSVDPQEGGKRSEYPHTEGNIAVTQSQVMTRPSTLLTPDLNELFHFNNIPTAESADEFISEFRLQDLEAEPLSRHGVTKEAQLKVPRRERKNYGKLIAEQQDALQRYKDNVLPHGKIEVHKEAVLAKGELGKVIQNSRDVKAAKVTEVAKRRELPITAVRNDIPIAPRPPHASGLVLQGEVIPPEQKSIFHQNTHKQSNDSDLTNKTKNGIAKDTAVSQKNLKRKIPAVDIVETKKHLINNPEGNPSLSTLRVNAGPQFIQTKLSQSTTNLTIPPEPGLTPQMEVLSTQSYSDDDVSLAQWAHAIRYTPSNLAAIALARQVVTRMPFWPPGYDLIIMDDGELRLLEGYREGLQVPNLSPGDAMSEVVLDRPGIYLDMMTAFSKDGGQYYRVPDSHPSQQADFFTILVQSLHKYLSPLDRGRVQLPSDGNALRQQVADYIAQGDLSLKMLTFGLMVKQEILDEIDGTFITVADSPVPAEPMEAEADPARLAALMAQADFIAAPGNWNMVNADLVPHALVESSIWPADHVLVIDRGDEYAEPWSIKSHAFPVGATPVYVRVRYDGSGHYDAINNDRVIKIDRDGNCFMNAVVMSMSDHSVRMLFSGLADSDGYVEYICAHIAQTLRQYPEHYLPFIVADRTTDMATVIKSYQNPSFAHGIKGDYEIISYIHSLERELSLSHETATRKQFAACLLNNRLIARMGELMSTQSITPEATKLKETANTDFMALLSRLVKDGTLKHMEAFKALTAPARSGVAPYFSLAAHQIAHYLQEPKMAHMLSDVLTAMADKASVPELKLMRAALLKEQNKSDIHFSFYNQKYTDIWGRLLNDGKLKELPDGVFVAAVRLGHSELKPMR